MAPKAAGDDGNAKWLEKEVLGMLNALIDKKTSAQSGNGWKPTVWTGLITTVQAIDPDAKPVNDKDKIVTKLKNLQATFALYLFCEKFSGAGWDDDKKMCVAEPEYIKDFLEKHGKKYSPCFKKPCPFYKELDQVFDGLTNRATGEHVVHLGSQKKTRHQNKENPSVAGPSSNTNAPGSPDHDTAGRAPMVVLANGHNEEDTSGGSQAGLFDDELSALTCMQSPAKTRKRMRAESDDKDTTDPADPKGKRRCHKSDSSSGSIARRNAEAGSQLARSVDGLSAAMAKPIVTASDVSYVDDIMEILNDTDLLPPDPRGEAFNIVSTALTSSHPRARVFILTKDDTRRKAMLRNILQEARFEVPDDY
ncbi:hypothetical protein C8R44DRAFT_724894 [Mycena epipterygia]|nr:hypothetical protein C8R44DRAFT_724894 [Mycena epipterygia]